MEDAARIARKLSALADMGFERVEAAPVTSQAARIDRKTWKITCLRPAMGTGISVTAIDASRDRAEEAAGRAFEEMDRLIRLFNRYDSASAVSQLNSDGRLEGAPPELVRVVSRALHYHGLSDGAFDISVKPLVDLFSTANGRAPGGEQVVEALGLVDARRISVDRQGIRFQRDGMGVTLDGIAKGSIVDAVCDFLELYGVKNHLINAGGDIRASGTKEGGRSWTVAVREPNGNGNGNFRDVVNLSVAAIATSGSYEIYFDRERLYHHIVNSRTGKSPHLNTSVSVVSPTTVEADALATAVFVMDPEKGIEFVNSLPRCECLIIDNEGHELKSKHWRSATPVPNERAGL
jgi:thiamine biosynthesis lipoprotein